MFKHSPDPVYVLEVAGIPTVAFVSKSLAEANEVARQDWLLKEFRKLRSRGRPVWDGKASIWARAATDTERSSYGEVATSIAERSGARALVYLIELDNFNNEASSPGGLAPRRH
jgi:hypothetical protein